MPVSLPRRPPEPPGYGRATEITTGRHCNTAKRSRMATCEYRRANQFDIEVNHQIYGPAFRDRAAEPLMRGKVLRGRRVSEFLSVRSCQFDAPDFACRCNAHVHPTA